MIRVDGVRSITIVLLLTLVTSSGIARHTQVPPQTANIPDGFAELTDAFWAPPWV
ncbi:MAG TPA: hypothetical protein VEL51_01700 [Vicinamibacterales bacterium]|nr:hypothetical protein [Vicinamibacterales bacterium]